MGKTLLILGLLLSVFLIGCASFSGAPASEIESRGFSSQTSEGPAGAAAPLGAPQMDEFISPQSKSIGDDAAREQGAFATPAPAASAAPGTGGGNTTLQLAQRQVISTASISIEVEEVQVASAEVKGIAESLGGFLEQLSSSGRANSQHANITIRVPQGRFSTAVERLMALGEVQNQTQGSEDVSERFIDLKARLKSAEREEQSLLSLLERSLKVKEILTVERELNRVRSEIERLQGQLNFLEGRVELATISVFLFTPSAALPQPPSGSLVIDATEVTQRLNELRSRVSSVGGRIDRVLLSEREERERAVVTFRVFPEDFAQTVEFLESLGVVRSKELQESPTAEDPEQDGPEEPNSRIEVTLAERPGPNTGLILGIGIPIVLFLAGLLGLGGYLAYRVGRRRASAA